MDAIRDRQIQAAHEQRRAKVRQENSVMLTEMEWLKKHPQFEQRPATIDEFLGPDYLNIRRLVREAVYEIMVDIFGDDPNPERIALYEEATVTGGIGIGKTTIASIAQAYMVHWVLCLRNPQEYFDLLPGSRIAFMQMSTSAPQAKEVVFSDIKARIDHSPWFRKYYPYDPKYTSQFRFPKKDIWILPGDSSETTFEGYNILGGVLDEADSHKVTKNKDYADQGYTTIKGRITSRFGNKGFLLVIGQKKKARGFVQSMWDKMTRDPDAYTKHLTIWESLGWEKFIDPVTGERDSFWYDTQRYSFTTKELAEFKGFPSHIIEVPNLYRKEFENHPIKALRDLAGMPPTTTSPFFHDPGKIHVARERWHTAMNHSEGPLDHNNEFAQWFRAHDTLLRAVHVDIAYSAEGDALGLAMGHVPEMIEVEGELKPFIFVDLVMRIKAPAGQEVILGDVRRIIYSLRKDRKFNIKKCTTDGFESTDFRQQMSRNRISTEVVSVDRSKLPYQDLHDALMEERMAIPPYLVQLHVADTKLVDIVYKEISELEDLDNKIDHPPDGSKDVADALAGLSTTLMGGKNFHARGSAIADMMGGLGGRTQVMSGLPNHPAVNDHFNPPRFATPEWKPPR